jgi:hypothetical protein
MHNYRYDQRHFKVINYAYLEWWKREHLKVMTIEHSKVYDSIHEYNYIRKENLKLNSAHDYSYENGSYSFKIKYTDKSEPTVLQKTFMCSNCLTLRHYYS